MPRHSVPNINCNSAFPRRRKNRLNQYFNEEPLKALNSNAKKFRQSKIQNRGKRSTSKPRTSRKPQNKTRKPSQHTNKKEKQVNIQQKGTPFNKFSKEYDSPQKSQQEFELLFGNRMSKKKRQSNEAVQIIIDKVDELLRENMIRQAISILNETITHHSNHSQLNYLLGACYLVCSQVQTAKKIFERMLLNQPRKNIYLLLSVCYKKMHQNQAAKQMLDMCIQKYPKYYEAYVYRAKIFLKTNQYRKGYLDFEKALTLKPQKIIGYIGKGDCLRLSSKFSEARAIYIDGLSVERDNRDLLIRKAICQLQLGKFDMALTSIHELLTIDPQNSEALYFKGLIYKKLGDLNQAIISFQQALKFNTNKRAITRSIYQLAKIEIQQKNYYEAVHTLQRAEHLETEEKVLAKLRVFTDGITSLMKKNYSQGLTALNDLDQQTLNRFLKPLFYSARAYGYMNQNKLHQAKADFDIMQRDFCLDVPNLYNKFICQGILACNQKKYEQALSFFSKAGKVMSSKLEPNFYKAVCLVSFAMKLIPKDMVEKRKEYLNSALKVISKIETISDSNPSLHLVRGVIYFALGHHEQAHTDFKNCLNQSIKHNGREFYLNGLLYGQLGQYSEAIKQFQTAIHYSDSTQQPQIYLNRAKCMLLLGDVNSAFMDLQSYMSGKASSPDIHIWAGHLLFHIGAWDDAAKAYSNINNLNKNFQVLLYKAKCHLISKDVALTITTFKTMVGIKADAKAQFDLELLEMLQNCAEESDIDYGGFSERLKVLRDKISESDDRQKLERLKGLKEGSQDENMINPYQISYLFTQSDYNFFTGVFQLHAGNYQKAIKSFKLAKQIQDSYFSAESSENTQARKNYRDLTFINLSFNSYEISYNLAMAYICNKQISKALVETKDLAKRIKQNKKNTKDNQLINKLKQLTQILEKQIDPKKTQNSKKMAFQIQPFPVESRLCSIFPQIIVQLKQEIIKTRIFFCLPHVKSPQIKPGFDEKILASMDMKWIDIKPEAPWIRRSEEGVIFTSVVAENDIQLSQSQKQEAANQEENQDQDYQPYEHQDHQYQNHQDQEQFNFQHDNSNPSERGNRRFHGFQDEYQQQQVQNSNVVVFDPKKLKMQLMLDPQIERKLNRKFN